VLSLDDFGQLRREICASGPARSSDNLVGMAMGFDWCPAPARTTVRTPACGRTLMLTVIQAPNG
jgi:hypothetical protein